MPNKFRWQTLILMGAFANCTAQAGPNAPPLTIQWNVNGGTLNLVQPQGKPAGDAFIYAGEAVAPATGLALSYSLTGNPTLASNPPDTLHDNVHIFNSFATPITVNAEVK